MSAHLNIQIFAKDSASCEEMNFFKAEEWTEQTEKLLMMKIQDLLSAIRHCGESFDVKINMEVADLPEAVFLVKKKINNHVEVNHQKLSLREMEVLELIMQGYTNQEIAEKLCVCFETVKSHRKHILLKSGAKNTAALINHYHQTFFEK